MAQRKMKIQAVFFIFFCISGTVVYGQTEREDVIDLEYHDCLRKDSSYANICDCAFVAYGRWDKELNKTYDKLLKTIRKEEDKETLRQSQKAWLAYRDAEFTTYNYIFNLQGNRWCSIRQNERIEMVRSRTLQLRYYLESLKSK